AQDKYEQAEPLFLESMETYKKTVGLEHPDVAELFENMAKLYKKTKREAEAKKLTERAKAIRKKQKDPK
ncbi:MAG: tetratricopeptide repeat protein, partial [Planctomycetes bacterium]|nr:tetratricopeptide repeat protein [Planctomycetota bacterium]